jgi:membrane fusion protein (multidrug efflux system)
MTVPAQAAAQPGRSFRRPLLAALVVLLCAALGVYLFVPDLLRAETDDAFVDAHIATISARVPGYVVAVHVDDNTAVGSGETLLELDPRDYQVRVATAQANLAVAESRLDEARAEAAVAATAIDEAAAEAEADASNARLAVDDLKRFEGVSDVRAVSTQRLDTARTAAAASRATLSAARTKVELARARAALARIQIGTAEAGVAQAQAALEQARLDLSYTSIVTPEAGTIADKLVETGNYVQPGQTLLSLVPTAVYVVANFKETQIDEVGVGRPATIRIDAVPGLVLHGHVDSLQRGSGARFALLPPENATGNFVKIVQRIPVKIVLDEDAQTLARLAPGMSAIVSIRYPDAPAWLGVFE